NGIAGVTDIDGDVILSYASGVVESYTTSNLTEVVVSSGYAIAQLRKIVSPLYVTVGEKNYIQHEICNLGNTLDTFAMHITTELPLGFNVYLVHDENQDKVYTLNENTIISTVTIPPDCTYYYFIVIEVSSDVPYGITKDIILSVKNQNGFGIDDGWYEKDTQITTFTIVTILPEVRHSLPIPVGLKINRNGDKIILSWNIAEYSDLVGFLIYKGESIETLCKIPISAYYSSTNTTLFVDNLVSDKKFWYKIKSIDKYANLSLDSMFISTDGRLVSVNYEDEILGLFETTQYNKALYKETSINKADLHIQLSRLNTEKMSDIASFEVCCFRNGVLSDKIQNTTDLDFEQTNLKLCLTSKFIKQKITGIDMQQISMFYFDNVVWTNIGGVPVGDYFVNKIRFSGKYKLSTTIKPKEFDVISIAPRKFYCPLEQPPLDKLRFVLKHRKTVKPVGKIFDLNGVEVKSLSTGIIQEGTNYTTTEFIWDGKDNNGKPVRSGIYIYQFESNDGVINGTVIVVK
ncbi:MAG: hypothetical protein N2555_01345, partial [Endomicrobia bacterium]|nr:hypothetical protein [Endomicrobiia bacterium]